MTEPAPRSYPQMEAWDRCERGAVAAVAAMNLATVALVEVIVELLATDGWSGWGIASPEHWVRWKANVSRSRAEGLVRIARRREELPACWALFVEGRLTEDAMVRIAARVPTANDAQTAGLAPQLMISQLARLLSSLPELPDPEAPPKGERERKASVFTGADGWGQARLDLPPDEWAVFLAGLSAARDAELRDRRDLPVDGGVAEADARQVCWADAAVRMGSEACDALDATLGRTGHRGERFQVVLRHDVGPDGDLGPGRFHLGAHVPDAIARYLACDANVIHEVAKQGRLIGITPAQRTPNRRLRRYLEQRDGGCAHPLCDTRRWLHAHHIAHWEDGGPTVPSNLVCLCPMHHRQLHHGDVTITGDPEAGTLRFLDKWGQAIAPPDLGAEALPPPPPTDPSYRPPCGERLDARWFAWN